MMVTRNRARLAARAVRCFARQTWADKELLILDDGEEDYAAILAPYRDQIAIRYERLAADPERKLGGLRNLALDRAGGDVIAQWDDDEWYHPERLAVQATALEQRTLDACLLECTLVHLDEPGFVEHPYRATLRHGTAGTVVHRRTEVRYPNWPRNEDTAFRARLRQAGARVGVLRRTPSHLFIRCFHGANTWDLRHFRSRLRVPVRDLLRYATARFVRGDLLTHPAFRLTELERQSVDRFLSDSRELGLLKHAAPGEGAG